MDPTTRLSMSGEVEVGHAAGATHRGISWCPMHGMMLGGSSSIPCLRLAVSCILKLHTKPSDDWTDALKNCLVRRIRGAILKDLERLTRQNTGFRRPQSCFGSGHRFGNGFLKAWSPASNGLKKAVSTGTGSPRLPAPLARYRPRYPFPGPLPRRA